MKKNIYNLSIILLWFTVLVLLLKNPNNITSTVLLSFDIWKKNIFTTLFPFFIISDLLINYGFASLLGEIFKNPIKRLFGLPKEASFVIIASMFSGFPSSAKYIKELLITKKISIKEAEYLLMFCHYPNPLFVMGIVSTILKSKMMSVIILISIITSNFVIAICIKSKKESYIKEKINIKIFFEDLEKNKTKKKFISILTHSIMKSINTLLLVLGIITTFMILSNLITTFFNNNTYLKVIIGSMLEMTQGIYNTSLLNIPSYIKASIIAGIISFGGLSIHMQTMGIIDENKIKYKYYFLVRCIHAILSSLGVLLLIKLLK